MEKPLKFKELWSRIQTSFRNNTSRNVLNIGLMVYYIIYAILSLSTLLGTGEIDLHAFWKILVLCINLPVLVVTSLILVGKWKGSVSQVEMQKTLYDVQLELELKKQEIDNLKLLQQHASVIGDLTEQLQRIKEEYREKMENQREIWEYKCQLAARDGKVPEALIANKGWRDANDLICVVDKKEEEEPVKDDAPPE